MRKLLPGCENETSAWVYKSCHVAVTNLDGFRNAACWWEARKFDVLSVCYSVPGRAAPRQLAKWFDEQ